MAASSENLASIIDPFLLRHSFSDYFWPTPSDAETLTLSKSIYDNYDNDFNNFLLDQNQNQSFSPFSSSDLEQHQIHKPTPSASDPETTTTPNHRTSTPSLNGTKSRITKRKSRATKKNQTTFITADPSNFRQMVQQVTGIKFDTTSSSSSNNSSSFTHHFLKPETRRPIGRLYDACLPTLDTSSFMLDRSQSTMVDRLDSVGGAARSMNGESGGGSSDGFANFPTLESWKVI